MSLFLNYLKSIETKVKKNFAGVCEFGFDPLHIYVNNV